MKTLTNASSRFFDNLFWSMFALYDGELDINGPDDLSGNDEPDASHPISYSYFGA